MSLTNFTPGGSAMKSRLPWSAFPQLPGHPPPVAQDGSSSDVDVVSDEGTVTHNGLVIDPASAANTAAVPGAGADLDVGGCTDEEILFRSGFRTDGGAGQEYELVLRQGELDQTSRNSRSGRKRFLSPSKARTERTTSLGPSVATPTAGSSVVCTNWFRLLRGLVPQELHGASGGGPRKLIITVQRPFCGLSLAANNRLSDRERIRPQKPMVLQFAVVGHPEAEKAKQDSCRYR